MKKMFLITGRVKHSQSLSVTPTHPWITVQEDGTVLMAHCTCKAGLGEVCSHAAALMYCVLASVDVNNGQACTQKPCAWAQPSMESVRGVQYAEIRNISFCHKQEPRHVQGPGFPDITPSDEECRVFFEMLHHSEMQESKPKKSAILSVIEGHSHMYTPKVMQLDLPTPLSNIYSSTWLEMDLPTLLVESVKVFDNLHLTQQQVSIKTLPTNYYQYFYLCSLNSCR
ncbi:uncharacterized protein LOC130099507 [Rhinichthys klamathensis goyatoka]|uniref:uncharacterized protein LOC130099507 n=1 Tax=Rhinichthys klamathensis goyatoka TaxID=3034132 RepID=UPI0024B6072E|nr:uncharacterized protein LOC130099507 [Rhinichthys klamathensis goyatoka]